MPALAPFTAANTVSLAVGSSSANVALNAGLNSQIMVTSEAGNDIAFIKFGTSSSASAATTDTPILPGTVQVFTIAPTQTYVAAIGTSGTTLYFTSGEGE